MHKRSEYVALQVHQHASLWSETHLKYIFEDVNSLKSTFLMTKNRGITTLLRRKYFEHKKTALSGWRGLQILILIFETFLEFLELVKEILFLLVILVFE